MRVVIDEGVPRQLVEALTEHGIDAARCPRGWISLSNGALIRACEVPHNRRCAISERADDVADAIRRAGSGAHIVIELDGTRIVRRPVAGELVVEPLPAVPHFRF